MAEPATISVALCTCNGEAFLQAQLDSIAEQTRLPDELVVGDDASTDRTLEILDAFSMTVPFPVTVESHDARLGVAGNFQSAVERCSGTCIAFCDQDDIWVPEKLAQLEAVMQAHPGWALVFHDLELVDGDLASLGTTMWQRIGFNADLQTQWQAGASLDLLLQRSYVTGAGLMLRRDALPKVLPFSGAWIHDHWLSMILATLDPASLGLVPARLTHYRQHESNEVGGLGSSDSGYVKATRQLDRRAYYTGQVEAFQALVDHVAQLPGIPHERLNQLTAKLEFLKRRAAMPRLRVARLGPIVRGLLAGDYRRYSRGWKLAVRDLMISG